MFDIINRDSVRAKARPDSSKKSSKQRSLNPVDQLPISDRSEVKSRITKKSALSRRRDKSPKEERVVSVMSKKSSSKSKKTDGITPAFRDNRQSTKRSRRDT